MTQAKAHRAVVRIPSPTFDPTLQSTLQSTLEYAVLLDPLRPVHTLKPTLQLDNVKPEPARVRVAANAVQQSPPRITARRPLSYQTNNTARRPNRTPRGRKCTKGLARCRGVRGCMCPKTPCSRRVIFQGHEGAFDSDGTQGVHVYHTPAKKKTYEDSQEDRLARVQPPLVPQEGPAAGTPRRRRSSASVAVESACGLKRCTGKHGCVCRAGEIHRRGSTGAVSTMPMLITLDTAITVPTVPCSPVLFKTRACSPVPTGEPEPPQTSTSTPSTTDHMPPPSTPNTTQPFRYGN